MMGKAPLETIAAVATPPGEGGIAVIRLSGKDAIAIADAIFSGNVKSYETHTLHFGNILDIDEGLVAVMKGPRSYTGEDVVEIHCHGGSLITKAVLSACLEAGAKAAGPGEFTYRAFMNGKLDLAQAEAVQSVIGAKNELALGASQKQLQGALSNEVQSFQKELLDIAAILEAWVDFPEEGLEFATKDEVVASLQKTRSKIEVLLTRFHEGKKLFDGLSLCLIGAPNAGKSSLMNALLGVDRAIVTDVPGTTRDLLEAEMRLAGLHIQLTDTAGIRATEEVVEKEGIRRSKGAMQGADLILLILDASTSLTEEEERLIESAPTAKTLLIWNKIDLPHTIPTIDHPHQVSLSAKTGVGLVELKEALEALIWQGELPSKEEVLLTNTRHKEALKSASKDLLQLIEGLQTDISPEFLSADMRSALSHLGEILGLDISEEILSSIFAKFCVGK